jgi:hypothetical protein
MTVSQFKIDTTGNLVPLSMATAPAQAEPSAIVAGY